MRRVQPPAADNVTILELSDRLCRYPIGDPKDAEFRYCGHRVEAGKSYCAYHSRLAYQTGRTASASSA